MIRRLALCLIVAAVFAGVAAASVANNVRFPRYDDHPVRVHVVTDAAFDSAYLTDLRDGIQAWTQTGDIQFDYPPPVASCQPTASTSAPVVVHGEPGPPKHGRAAAAPRPRPAPKPKPAPTPKLLPANTICVTTYFDSASTLGAYTSQTYLPALGSDGKLLVNVAIVAINLYWFNHDNQWWPSAPCHEFGHVLGLDHPEIAEATFAATCMTNDYSRRTLVPSADDLALLQAIYSVRDSR